MAGRTTQLTAEAPSRARFLPIRQDGHSFVAQPEVTRVRYAFSEVRIRTPDMDILSATAIGELIDPSLTEFLRVGECKGE